MTHGGARYWNGSMPSTRAPQKTTAGPERQAAIHRAIEAGEDLERGRLSAGIAEGMPGRSVLPL